MILKEKEIPDKPGVYLMKNSGGRTIYVGKAANLRRRLGQYFGTQRKSFKVNILVNRIRQVDYLVTASERESLILEDILIKKYQPFYNTLLKDDKSYPYLKITGEKFPRLMLARKSKSDDGKGTYYGPYPQTPGLKNIVALLNATFQLRPCKYDLDAANRDYDNCIYLQTERCSGPCQKNVSSVQYGKNVRKLRLFLEGKYSALEKKLKEEMKRFADRMEFEKAAAARDVINSLNNMRSRIRVGRLFPADLDAVRTITDDLAMLKDALGLKKYPSVIECIDISNMGESFPVGSVVRFHLGEPDRANYRKYKIKQRGLQDDFAMISEVLERRLRRLSNESPQNLPDLIVVDGGKGQLNSAVTVLKKLQLKIDLISIAKSPRDTIYLPSGSNPITITGSDRHLFVIQRIRDEAHRFALSFHRNLRAKKHCHRDTEVTEKKQRTKNKIKISVLSVVNLFLVTLAFGGEAKYDHLINRYAMEHGLDPALVKAVIKAESNFNPFCVSHKGAVGLMQLMPGTAKLLSVKNIRSPEENIRGGTQYLRDMLWFFGGDLQKALAAYNAGPGKVRKYGGVPPYRETQQYIKQVLKYRRKYDTDDRVSYYIDKDGCIVFYNR